MPPFPFTAVTAFGESSLGLCHLFGPTYLFPSLSASQFTVVNPPLYGGEAGDVMLVFFCGGIVRVGVSLRHVGNGTVLCVFVRLLSNVSVHVGSRPARRPKSTWSCFLSA